VDDGPLDDADLARRLLRSATLRPAVLLPDRALARYVRGSGPALPLVNAIVRVPLPSLLRDGRLGRSRGIAWRAYIPAAFAGEEAEGEEGLVLRLHHYTRSADLADVHARRWLDLSWRGPAWALERLTGRRVCAVEWVIFRRRRPSPLPVVLEAGTGVGDALAPKLLRRATDTDALELDATLALHPALAGTTYRPASMLIDVHASSTPIWNRSPAIASLRCVVKATRIRLSSPARPASISTFRFTIAATSAGTGAHGSPDATFW
jgi:hypothetical protein